MEFHCHKCGAVNYVQSQTYQAHKPAEKKPEARKAVNPFIAVGVFLCALMALNFLVSVGAK